MGLRSRRLAAAITHGVARQDPRVQELEAEVARLKARIVELEDKNAVLRADKDTAESELKRLKKDEIANKAHAHQMHDRWRKGRR